MAIFPMRTRPVDIINKNVSNNRAINDDLMAVLLIATRSQHIMELWKYWHLHLSDPEYYALQCLQNSTLCWRNQAIVQSAPFALHWYEHPECSAPSDARQNILSQQVSCNSGAARKLQCLLPTHETFMKMRTGYTMAIGPRTQSGKKWIHWHVIGPATTVLHIRSCWGSYAPIGYDSIHSTAHPSKNDSSNYECFPADLTLKLRIRRVFVLATFMASL